MVAFGKVLEGMELVDRISLLPSDKEGTPLEPVFITDCGEVDRDRANTDGGLLQQLRWISGSDGG